MSLATVSKMISRVCIFTGLLALVHANLIFCPPNEIWSLSTCSEKCSDMNKGRDPRIFEIFRCICKPNFKRDDKSNKCIRKEDCCRKPKEVYSEVKPDRTCEDVVGNTIPIPIPPPIRGGRCICDPNSARDRFGNCVPVSECYPKCIRPNEVYKKLGCDQTCNLYGGAVDVCKLSWGCFCRDGFVRQKKGGKCISRSECRCDDPNECYRTSGCVCEKDCKGNYSDKCSGPPRCYCKEGYRRKNGKCIKADQCKKICYPKPKEEKVKEEEQVEEVEEVAEKINDEI